MKIKLNYSKMTTNQMSLIASEFVSVNVNYMQHNSSSFKWMSDFRYF